MYLYAWGENALKQYGHLSNVKDKIFTEATVRKMLYKRNGLRKNQKLNTSIFSKQDIDNLIDGKDSSNMFMYKVSKALQDFNKSSEGTMLIGKENMIGVIGYSQDISTNISALRKASSDINKASNAIRGIIEGLEGIFSIQGISSILGMNYSIVQRDRGENTGTTYTLKARVTTEKALTASQKEIQRDIKSIITCCNEAFAFIKNQKSYRNSYGNKKTKVSSGTHTDNTPKSLDDLANVLGEALNKVEGFFGEAALEYFSLRASRWGLEHIGHIDKNYWQKKRWTFIRDPQWEKDNSAYKKAEKEIQNIVSHLGGNPKADFLMNLGENSGFYKVGIQMKTTRAAQYNTLPNEINVGGYAMSWYTALIRAEQIYGLNGAKFIAKQKNSSLLEVALQFYTALDKPYELTKVKINKNNLTGKKIKSRLKTSPSVASDLQSNLNAISAPVKRLLVLDAILGTGNLYQNVDVYFINGVAISSYQLAYNSLMNYDKAVILDKKAQNAPLRYSAQKAIDTQKQYWVNTGKFPTSADVQERSNKIIKNANKILTQLLTGKISINLKYISNKLIY